MIIASTGDLHADQHNIGDTKIGMSSMLRVLDDNHVDLLLLTGDIFHNFNIGGKNESFGSVFHSINEPLTDWIMGDERRRIIMIPGNHDTPTNIESRDALTSFEFRDRIHVARSIGAFKVAPDIMITTLPWMYPSMYANKKNLLEELSKIRANTLNYTNILMGHCEIAGSEIATGYTMFGGHFEFDYKTINELDFDYVTLGHVHKQQGFYTGVPWQHNFGDEQLQGQIRIIEIADGIHTDKMVDIPNTPKYYNITVDDLDTFTKRKMDHVKVVGSKLTKELPEGYRFEKSKNTNEIVPRTNISCNDTIQDLLYKWMKEVYTTDMPHIDELLEIVESIGANESYGKKHGSLEFFDSIHIKGIGPHKDTQMDFNDAIVAISGPNGCGKTIFMENLYAGLYGELPSYGKLSALADDIASLEIKFHTNTDNYRVLRKVNKGKQTAYVYKNGSKKALMGPKVSEVNAFMTKIVGPKELLQASVFSTQIYAGDIVDLEPSKRKDVFHKLLGLGVFAEIKEEIDDRLKASNTKKEVLSNQLKTVRTISEITKAVTSLALTIAEDKFALGVLKGDVDKYHDKKAEADQEYIKFERVVTAKNLEDRSLVEYRDLLNETKAELSKLEDINSASLTKERDAKQKELDAEAITYKQQNKEYAELVVLNNDYAELDNEYLNCSNGLEALKDNHNTTVEILLHKISDMEGVGCSEDPLPCPFIDHAVDAPDTLKEKVSVHEKKVENWEIKKAHLFNKRELSRDAINNHKITDKDQSIYGNLEQELKAINLKLDEALILESKAGFLEKDVTHFLILIADSKTAISKLDPDAGEKLIATKNQMQHITDSLGKCQLQITAKEVSIAEGTKDVEFLGNEFKRLDKFQDELFILNQEIPKLETLSKAFSKNGIPQLIIDSALPQLQDILDILANFINKFSIEIKTQKLNQDGTSAKETIDFIVDDGIKPRDVKFYSGGEKKLLKTLIRLSLSLFQSQRTGNSYKLLLMDETFDALDPENSLILLKILYNLKTKFKQIFVISHSDDILGRLAKCIKFQRKGNRTLIDG